MPRADRLLTLLQILRRHRRPVTAETIANELDVSVRTVYRDIAALIADGVPVDGEAGIGYLLQPGFDLPPLMLTADEVEALIVGMSWVEARADAGLASAARDVISKVGAVLPKALAPLLVEQTVAAAAYGSAPRHECIDVSEVRRAIRERRVVDIGYIDEAGKKSQRTLWPLAIGYFELSRVLVAWCELRQAFRHFRTDRILSLTVAERRYPGARAKLMQAWREEEARNCHEKQGPRPRGK